MMQRKPQLVKWGPSIFALLIVWLTTFAGGLLVTRASVGLDLKTKQSCQLVKNSAANTKLIVDGSIPDSMEDLLNGDNGTQKYGLRCKNSQKLPQNKPPKGATPCIETSTTTCVTPGPTSSVGLPIGSPAPLDGSPTPSESASPTPSESASSTPSESASPTPPSESASPTPSGNASPSALISVNCVPKNNQEVCSITAPSGLLSTTTSNGTVTCTFQNNQIECKGTGLIPILKSILGMTLPPSGAISCALQNAQIVCTGGTSGANSLISCTLQDGVADCKAAIPSNVSVGLPTNKTLTCTRQNSQIVCTTNDQSSPSNSSKIATDQLNHQLSCRLIKGMKGNTQLTFASDIPSNIKDQLKGQTSLEC